MESLRQSLADKLRTENKLVRELLAELIGTFFLVFIGTAANAQATFAIGGNSTSCHIAWGIGFFFAVFLAAPSSGAHLNPAISFTAFLFGKLSAIRLALYSITQIIGGFFGAAVTFLGHLDDITKFDSGIRMVDSGNATAGLFATYPTPHMTTVGSLFDQIIGTAMLSGLVWLITDERRRVPDSLKPIMVGSIMSMVAMTFGANGAFAINPARDLGPRFFLLCAGYGWKAFSAHNYYVWIPIVGPLIGAPLGACIYKLFVGLHGLDERLEINPPSSTYPRNDKGYRENCTESPETLVGYRSREY